MVQESDRDGRQAGEAGNGAERHQCAERGQEARGGRRDLQAALAGGGVFPGRDSADAAGRVTITLHHRFLTEDVPYGYMAVSRLGRKYGVPTPRIDLLVSAYQYLLADKAEMDGPEFDLDVKEVL